MARTTGPANRVLTALALCAGTVVLAGAMGMSTCRQGVPVIDSGPKPANPNGTISGTVRGPEGTSAIEGRTVEVINVDTGERYRETTSSTGGFTIKVKPGRYRVEVTLQNGEAVIKQPGIMTIDKSDLDAHADFIVGVARVSHPSHPSSLPSSLLGPPIA